MTTPIERGAEAIAGEYDRRNKFKPGTWWSARHRRDPLRDEARAVFESIDRDELADVIYPEIRLSPDHRPAEMVRALHTADAIIAYLTGDQS